MKPPSRLLAARVALLFVLGVSLIAFRFTSAQSVRPSKEGAGGTAAHVAIASFAPLVDAVRAAVVNVEVTARVPREEASAEDLLEKFFGGTEGGGSGKHDRLRQGSGSGTLIDPRGFILTNNHVVQGATSIRITLDDGRNFEGAVLGRDPLTDVALIRLKEPPKDLQTVRIGDSDAVHVGDWVVAIGNPFGLVSSVSAGILSARTRDIGAGPYDEFLQTDAAINPGNSGGPLFDLDGHVIGINTAIVGGGTGIGFAVPSNIASELLTRLEAGEEVVRGWLGVAVQDLTPPLAKGLGIPIAKGAIVSDVNSATPAAKAGLKNDDVVVAVDGHPVESAHALTRTVAFKTPGSTVTLTLYRGTEKKEIPVVLGKRPDLEGVEPVRGGAPSSDANASGPKIGMKFRDATREEARALGVAPPAVVVTDVVPGSAADYAGLRPEMVILEAGKKPVRSASDLSKALRKTSQGSVVLLRVQAGDSRALRALTVP